MKSRFGACAWLALLSPVALGQSAPDPDDNDFEVGGRVMIDSTYFSDVHNDGERGSEWELRRARVGIKHKKNDWEAELELSVDQADETVDITDGYIQYKGWDGLELTVGRMKEPFGLENLTSSLDISTMERSMVTEAFAPGRNYGVSIVGGTDLHTWAVGGFSVSENEAGMDGYAATGRFTLSPINSPGRVLHLGLSGSIRDMQGEEYEVNDPAEVNTGDKIIESRTILAESINQFSVEGAFVHGRFSLQTEWMQQYLDEVESDVSNGRSVDLSGQYVLASWFLTGDSRTYDDGSFDEVKPTGDAGAWELVLRYSDIDLIDSGEGVRANTWLAGVNYYATSRVRLMLNIARVEVEEGDAEEAGEGDSVGFRIQYEF